MKTYDGIVTYLRSVAEGREVMKGKHLQIVFGWSSRVQSDRRDKGTMPFPYQQDGRGFIYSIYDVAEYLFYGSQKAPEQPTEPSPLKPVAKRHRTPNDEDLSYLFTFSTFLEKVTKEANFLNELQRNLEVRQREIREEELREKLILKEDIKDKVRRPI